jgi:flavin reductase (DIM6/NTAB) family NADH-FMN oxidoreductase RutF
MVIYVTVAMRNTAVAVPGYGLAGIINAILMQTPMAPLTPQSAPAASAAPPSFSSSDFRAALGMFATGVTIVTARTAAGSLVGLTANSFNSVSMLPPLVLWSLGRNASSMEAFSAGSHYAVHILSASQKALAEQFASKAADRWQGVVYSLSDTGVPLLPDCVARFECFNRSRYQEGDHVIFVGEVERCSAEPGATPLLFHGGKFYTEHPL